MLPAFRYHPNPNATGNVKASDKVCVCCGKARGYIYTSSVYARETLRDTICPWCIADGSAAEKFEAMFCDDHPLAQAGLSDAIIEEVSKRTPGYNSWQQEDWLCCCNDACEFHGDAPMEELSALHGNALAEILSDWSWKEKNWQQFYSALSTGRKSSRV